MPCLFVGSRPTRGSGSRLIPSPWGWSTGPGLCKRPVCKTKVESFQILETADVIARSIIPGHKASPFQRIQYSSTGEVSSHHNRVVTCRELVCGLVTHIGDLKIDGR